MYNMHVYMFIDWSAFPSPHLCCRTQTSKRLNLCRFLVHESGLSNAASQERLYAHNFRLHPELAGKLTGMSLGQ